MRKGQRVLCVDDQFTAHVRQVYQNLPKKGVTYTIRAVYLGRGQLAPATPGESDGEVGLLLEEVRNQDAEARFSRGGFEPGFASIRFAELEEHAEVVENSVDVAVPVA